MSKTMKYDRQDVLKKATDLYWQKGFHGTSMRNLQDVIDMRPGSIYATFGSKEELYKESLQYYAEQGMARLTACSEATSSPLAALKMFMKTLISGNCATAPSDMCMLVKTVSELTEENAELLCEAKRLLHMMENAFAALFAQAQSCGELDETKDPAALARYMQVQIMGLRTYLRANNDGKVKVDKLIDALFEKGLV